MRKDLADRDLLLSTDRGYLDVGGKMILMVSQPDDLDGEEFNTNIIVDNVACRCKSIDLDFDDLPASEASTLKRVPPAGTTKQQWDYYHEKARLFQMKMDSLKPVRENFRSGEDYERAKGDWFMALSCDAPNKPGYTVANND